MYTERDILLSFIRENPDKFLEKYLTALRERDIYSNRATTYRVFSQKLLNDLNKKEDDNGFQEGPKE